MRRRASLVVVGLVLALVGALVVGLFLDGDGDGDPAIAGASEPAAATTPAVDLEPAPVETPALATDEPKAEAEPEAPTTEETVTLEEELSEAEALAATTFAMPKQADLPPYEGEGLTGRVLDLAGQGIPNAKVSLLAIDLSMMGNMPEGMRSMVIAQWKKAGAFSQMLREQGQAKTDAEGRFLLKPSGQLEDDVWLRIEHPERVRALSAPFTLEGYPQGGVEVVLPTGGTLKVAVRTPDGKPAASPNVTLDPKGEAQTLQASPLAFEVEAVTSYAHEIIDGQSVFRSVTPGPVAVRASVQGFKSASGEALVPAGGEASIDLQVEEGLTLSGVVVDDEGAPIAKANVWAQPMASMRGGMQGVQPATAQTGADGRFTLAGLEQEPHHVSSHANGYQQAMTMGFGGLNTHTPGEGKEVRIVLSKLRQVSGRVLLATTGESAPDGLTVTATSSQNAWQRLSANTDPAGAFHVVGLTPGSYRLEVSGKGWTTLDAQPVQVGKADVDGVEIRVQQGATVDLTVVGKDGGVVAGAEVQALTTQDAMVGGFTPGQQASPLTTDDAGHARLTGLKPGEMTLRVSHPRYAKSSVPLVVEGTPTQQVRVELSPGATLEGVLQKADGTPAAETMLMLAPASGQMGPDAYQNTMGTDAEGRFTRDGLAAGSYRIQVMNMGDGGFGGMSLVGEVQLAAGETKQVTLTLQAEQSLGKVSGHVLRGDRPQTGAPVMIQREDQNLSSGYAWSATDGEGAFTTEGLEPGRYTVSTGGAEPQVIDVQAGATAQVTLQVRAGVVAGRVFGPGGEPTTANLFLKSTSSSGNALDSWLGMQGADPAGRFSFDTVRPGSYLLVARSAGVGATPEAIPVTLGADAAATGIEVRLSRGGELTVRVARPDGTPAAGATVSLFHQGLSVSDQQLGNWMQSRVTDRHGALDLTQLVPGDYVIYASSAASGQAVQLGVSVADGGRAELDLALRPSGTLDVQAPPGTTVTLMLAGDGDAPASPGSPWSAMFGGAQTNAEGLLTLDQLPEVSMRVLGKTSDGRELSTTVTVPSGERVSVSLQ